jgi:hypothetical protein
MRILTCLLIFLVLAGSVGAVEVGNADTATGRLDKYMEDVIVISEILGSEITENLTTDSAYVYCEGLASGFFKIVLYDDNSGAPGDTILTTSEIGSDGTSRKWYVEPITASLTSGNSYWVGVVGSKASNASKTTRGESYGEWTDNTGTFEAVPADGSGAVASTDEDTLKAVCVYIVAHTASGETVYIGIEKQSASGARLLQSESGASAIHEP